MLNATIARTSRAEGRICWRVNATANFRRPPSPACSFEKTVRSAVQVLRESRHQPAMYGHERLESGERVRERKEQQVDIPRLHARDLRHALERRQLVRVGLDHALGLPGGTGRVHDGRYVLAVGGGHPIGQGRLNGGTAALPRLSQRLPAQHGRLVGIVPLDDRDLVGARVPGHPTSALMLHWTSRRTEEQNRVRSCGPSDEVPRA